jgi:hypothetical protein
MLNTNQQASESLALWGAETMALDGWISSQVGPAWEGVKRAWWLESTDINRENAWRWVLLTRFIAATIADGGVSEQALSKLVSELEKSADGVVRSIGTEATTFDLVSRTLPLDACLNKVLHPEVCDRVVKGVDRTYSFEKVTLNIAEALSIVAMGDPASRGMIDRFCRAIAIVESIPPLEQGLCISSSSREIPGLVFISDVPILLMAESLVHESSHLCLSSYEKQNNLYADDEYRLVDTPLRTDKRPVRGLLHQVWVLINLVRYYTGLRFVDDAVVARNREKILKRLSLHERDLNDGVALLEKNVDMLNSLGSELFARMREK